MVNNLSTKCGKTVAAWLNFRQLKDVTKIEWFFHPAFGMWPPVLMRQTYHTWILTLLLGLMIFRVWGLFLIPLGLHGDEAQYWAWSKDLDWGYFTKPPMIAWVIALTTSIFGDAEWAVRLSSPIIHCFTAYVIFRTARTLFDDKTGFWAAIIYILMPAVWLSSAIVSTDVSLLFWWAVALNAWVHLRQRRSWVRVAQLGLALGLAFLSKYAILFFFPALILAILFDEPTRKALLSKRGVLAASIFLIVIAPNVLWNMGNDFATVTHTAANANVQSGIPFYPQQLLEFWISQFVVFGPITLSLLIAAFIAVFKRRLDKPSLFLATFVLSPLLIISIQALMSRANANWAVSAYVAAPILTSHFCVKYWPKLRNWLRGGIAIQFAICMAFIPIMLNPAWTDAAGMANSVKRLRAWPETVTHLEEVIAKGHEGTPYQSVVFDKRIIFYDLKYYGLEDTLPLRMWLHKSYPQNQAELTAPLRAGEGPYLFINYEDVLDDIKEDFERLESLPPLDIDLGGGKRRTIDMWAAYGYTPTTTR